MAFDWQQFFNRAGKVTIGTVVLCILIYLVTNQGSTQQDSLTHLLTFNKDKILNGEIWRLLTPAFIHFKIGGLPIHLLFNMMWLWDLGGSIEKRLSPKFLIVLILVIGIGANVIQYVTNLLMYGEVFADYRVFGGMSGVVYGLLGFLFVRKHFEPAFPIQLNNAIMQFMLIWLVLGFTGLLGPIANAAHLGGLIIGAIIGYVTAKKRKLHVV